jgi:dihydrofolate synthase / folylpolyglutamate synthase
VTTRLQARLEALYGLERRRDKLGLEGTRALLAALGDPQDRFAAIHVAGTNGKGSVCAWIESILRAAGHRTGLYTSPHLVHFSERIRVGGVWADEAWLDHALDRIESLPEGKDRTFFEVATALGFLHFAEREVEVAVVEVGLGGRLDSTNVITPDLCVITPIAIDHAEILGDTVERIAAEKAGIVKPGVPVICDDADPRALAAIAAAGKACGAPVVPLRAAWNVPAPAGRIARSEASPLDLFVASLPRLDEDGIAWSVDHAEWGPLELRSGMRGRHQVRNLQLALTATALWARNDSFLNARTVTEGVARARWPGRLEPCPGEPRLWWDGAHNVAGIRALLAAWSDDLGFAPPGAVVIALSRDKEAAWILDALAERFPDAAIVVTRTTNARAGDPSSLGEAARTAGREAAIVQDVPRAIDHALATTQGRVLLTGSLFAVGEAMEARGGAPGERL